MRRLVYYAPSAFKEPQTLASPGVEAFLNFSRVFSPYDDWCIPVDRTGLITTPIRSLSLFPVPTYRPFTKSYDEICGDRGREILNNADSMGVQIYALYSGGIDSTCMLVSLLNQATPAQRKRIVVLLSQDSIRENPRFYEEYIKGQLQVGSSVLFTNLIGANDILLSAEHNDLVMGNANVGSLISRYGSAVVHELYNRDLLVDFFGARLNGDQKKAEFCFEMFQKLAQSAPVPITTNFDFLWWYNFATKWQACFSYMLLFTSPKNAPNVTKDYLDTRFISFYNTDEFQLWAMNNLDKRIKDTWRSYKWVLKDIIYDFTKDQEYRDYKTKVRSLPIVLQQQYQHYKFIDENIQFRNDLTPEDVLVPKNDFS